MDEVGAIVAGAGVVGLAVARELALSGREVLVLEREARFGSLTSSRNSEVIHAGLYYPPGSHKAELCVEGRERLYAFCQARGVAHRRCGKLIFAADPTRLGELDAIAARAEATGAGRLERLDGREAARREPALACAGALLSPRTGIMDSHGLMLALLAEVQAIGRAGALWTVRASGTEVSAPLLVNAAGLDAPALAARTEGLEPAFVPRAWLAKGSYFTYAGRAPFSRLIYPLPEPGGLGIHLTLDLAGQARFGPDVEWLETADYGVDPARKPRFLAAARRIWPGIEAERLQPGYAGLRPKLSGPGEPAADFRLDGPGAHGLPGLVNLFGIESPGLTASLALAGRVAAMALEAV